MILSQVVLLPLLALFTWGYLSLHRPNPRRQGILIAYDALVIIAAALFCLVAARWIDGLEIAGDSPIWATVMKTVATFHVFPAVLLAGWLVRRRLFRSR